MINALNKVMIGLGLRHRVTPYHNYSVLNDITRDNKDFLPIQYLQNESSSCFFGYHDKSPSTYDGSKILANCVNTNDTKNPINGTKLKVGYFEQIEDGNNYENKFIEVSETTAWNWQQGCMLQWYPSRPETEIIYNEVIDDKYVSIIFDIETREIKRILNLPIYCVDQGGKYAASLNFARLGRIRKGYGYTNLSDDTFGFRAPKNEGIHLINLETGKHELIIDLYKLTKFTLHEHDHYINHITFSPDGNYITFFHFFSDYRIKKINRFYLYNIEEKKLTLLESNRTVSHYCWINSKEIFTTEKDHTGYLYYLYDLNKEVKINIKIPNIGDLHPMVNPVNSDIIVADSRPDRKRNQHLFLFNIRTGDYRHIGSFNTNKLYEGPVRCDLHPRWDRLGHKIVIDTTAKGKRSLGVLNVHDGIWN